MTEVSNVKQQSLVSNWSLQKKILFFSQWCNLMIIGFESNMHARLNKNTQSKCAVHVKKGSIVLNSSSIFLYVVAYFRSWLLGKLQTQIAGTLPRKWLISVVTTCLVNACCKLCSTVHHFWHTVGKMLINWTVNKMCAETFTVKLNSGNCSLKCETQLPCLQQLYII